MSYQKIIVQILGLVVFASCANNNNASTSDEIDEVASLYAGHQVIGDIEYANIGGESLKLDLYVPAHRFGGPPWVEYSEDKKPVLLFLHGGGWQGGNKISRSLFLMPYVSKDWVVVTADYRLIPDASMTEIMSDCRMALNWVYENAEKYKFDLDKIVVSGESAGGHLALTTGFITDDNIIGEESAEIKRQMKVAAVVNWFGVVDLNICAQDWDSTYLSAVVQDAPDQEAFLKLCSPATYVSPSSPPVLSIHGDLDVSAPYGQSVLLKHMLDSVDVKNEFYTVEGKKHGNFSAKDMTAIFKVIWGFLDEVGI